MTRRRNILRFLIRAARAAACRGLLALFGAGRGLRHRRRAHVMAERLHGFCFGLFAAGVCAGDRLHTGLRAGRLGRDPAAVPLVARRGNLFGLRRGAAGVCALKCLDALRRAGRSRCHRAVVPLVARRRDRGFISNLCAALVLAVCAADTGLRAGRRLNHFCSPERVSEFRDGLGFGFRAAAVRAFERLDAILRTGRLGRDLAAVPLVTRRGDLFGLRRGAAGIGALKCLDSLRRAGRSGRYRTVVPLVAGRGDGFNLGLGAAGYCAFIHRLSALNTGRRSGRTGVPDVIMSSNSNSDRAGGNDAWDSVFIQITNLGIDRNSARSKRRSIFDSEYERQHRANVRRTSVIGRQPGSACPDFQAGHARIGKAYLFQHVRIVADAYLHTDDSRAAGNADRNRHFIAAAACSRCDGEIHGFSIGIRPRAQKRRHHENCEDYRQCFFHDFALLFI